MWQWIKDRFSLFRPVELAVLNAVAQNLLPEVRSIFEAQLRTINKVQRHSAGREVNLYHSVGNKSRFDDGLRFRNRGTDILLAKVAIETLAPSEHLEARAWLTSGRIFSITFDQSPSNASAIFRIITTAILADPDKEEQLSQTSLDPSILRGKLAEWRQKWSITKVRPPLNSEVRWNRMHDLGIVGLSDYEEMLQMTDGFNVGEWRVHGLAEVRSIVDSDDTLVVLAENDGVGCLVASTQNAGELRLVLYDGPEVQKAGRSFAVAMETLLSRNK